MYDTMAAHNVQNLLQVAPQKCEGHQILPIIAVKLPGMSGTSQAIGRYVITYLLFYWTCG
jgi:hypothetical protein